MATPCNPYQEGVGLPLQPLIEVLAQAHVHGMGTACIGARQMLEGLGMEGIRRLGPCDRLLTRPALKKLAQTRCRLAMLA